MARIEYKPPILNLYEMKKLLLQTDASIGIYNSNLILIAESTNFCIDSGDYINLLMVLSGDSLEKATISQKMKTNTTIKYIKDKARPMYMDLIWFYDELGDSYCLAFLYVNNRTTLEQHTNNFALLHSNYHLAKEAIQNILSASYIGNPANYDFNNLKHIRKEALKLTKYNSDNDVITKIISDVWPMKYAQYDILLIIQQIVNEYKNSNRDNNIKFIITSNAKEAIFHGDRYYLTKAFTNIFANMIMFSGKKSEVINIDICSNYVETVIRITDKKLFLNEHLLESILSGRLDKLSESPHYGLYLANSIILWHQGIFSIRSNNEIGTEICIAIQFNNKLLEFRDSYMPDDSDMITKTITSELSIID